MRCCVECQWDCRVLSWARGLGRTCLAASFSSFSSFSLAFIADMATRSFARFSNDDSPEVGRNAFFVACHCLPSGVSIAL